MASSNPDLPVVSTKPLSNFDKIGYNTYLYTPSSFSPPQSPLILYFSWNAAAAKHIEKYTVLYQRHFPSARILLLRSFTADLFQSDATFRERLTPTMDVIENHIASGGEILAHSASNGGGTQIVELSRAWLARTKTPLPMRIHVLDSSPGKGEWSRSHAAMVAALPKGFFWELFGGAIIHLVLVGFLVFNTATGRENQMTVMCRQLNDPTIFNARTPRVYLYSKADTMVGYDEVEQHANEGAAKGWNVMKVRFEKSAHAGHIREDEKKYFDAIMDAWSQAGMS